MVLNLENLLKKYYTARIDIKNLQNKHNNVIIVENNDLNSKIMQPNWFTDSDGVGTIIESINGELNLKIKCVGDGDLNIWLRGPDIRDKNNKRFPIYIDYVKFLVNNKNVFNNNTLIWHDNPYKFVKEVHNSEILDIHIKWLPFNEFSEFKVEDSHEPIQALKEKLDLREKQINSIPRLCDTPYGYSALDGKVTYRNWSTIRPSQHSLMEDLEGYCENFWFTKYLKNKFPGEDFDINIFAVSNTHDNLAYPMYGKKVLYAIENLNYRYLEFKFRFDRYALDYVDFAMGNDIIKNRKYLRFPYWFVKNFSPEVTEEEIEQKVSLWNSINYEKSKQVTTIASQDRWGTRTLISNDIDKLVNVTHAGRWRNNTSDLWEKYNNNKRAFLKQYRFNICAENLLDNAYITEKIFDAISCDCIPLYAGGGNYLEPEVLNPKAIIRWDAEEQYGYDPDLEEKAYMGCHDVCYPVKWVADDDRNQDSIELFKNLLTDKKTYNEFKDQDKVLSSSSKYIIKKFNDLEKHFERLIYS